MIAPTTPLLSRPTLGLLAALLLAGSFAPRTARAEKVLVEGENPVKSTMNRHPWWYEKVKRDSLSGGDLIGNFHEKLAGEATYRVVVAQGGRYDFWVHANPVKTRLLVQVNDSAWAPVDMEREQQGNTNISLDNAPDIRFIAWARAGSVTLKKGANVVRFRMNSENQNHGMLDCFVVTNEPFNPATALNPAAARAETASQKDWFAFTPPLDRFSRSSAIDLRSLNETVAGEGGPIAAKDGRFIHSKTGKPVRFWAVNGPPSKDPEALRREARILAKYGVNLVRVHHPFYNGEGAIDPAAIRHAVDVVEAMKAEGVYTHISIYFPVWLKPAPNTPWLQGYDGQKAPFAALFFNREFQKVYRSWWKALLLAKNPTTGKRLVDDPALAGLEILNEDSLFFWTFNPGQIPEPQLRMLETQFGRWLAARYGTLAAAMKRWGSTTDPRDKPSEGRVGFRPLWNMANERTPRDKDAARFLAETQRQFYTETVAYLRDLGFKGVITASNWITADPRVLGPIEKYTYEVGDMIDRHGYFAGAAEGPDVAWAIKESQSYTDASALRFDPAQPGSPRRFDNPVMDPSYDNKPSMLSEVAFNRPNRFRSEAPLYFAAYGALQGSDAIIHFSFDTASWNTKPGYFMQPWTLMSPAMVGQFPAAALIYRKGLIAEGDLLVDLNIKPTALFDLQGTPMPQNANLDELRLKDVPKGTTLKPGNVIDPLVHFAGRANVSFSERGGPNVLKNLAPFIDHAKTTVVSTNGQLRLDYGKGVLVLNAPAAQGVSGALRDAGTIDLTDLSFSSGLELGHIVAVSLDDRPLASAKRILLQVMSEEKASGFLTGPGTKPGYKTILNIGHDPWLVKTLEGTVRFKRSDASRLTVTPLNGNGEPTRATGHADEVRLAPTTLYYLIEAGDGK